MKQLNDWLDFFAEQALPTADKSLSRIQYLADALDICALNGKVITVTGTNGKGSTVKALEQIYLAAGFSVAAFTSPHILKINERLTFNGVMIDDASFAAALAEVERLRIPDKPIGWYDVVYLALAYCVQQLQPEVVLIEAGVGGLCDFSNLYDSSAAIITSIDIDHEKLLGDSREKIAFQKAHLGRPGRPLICAEPDMPVTVSEVVKNIGAQLIDVNHYQFSEGVGQAWGWQGGGALLSELPKPKIKLSNAAAALMAVTLLQPELTVSRSAICEGLAKTVLPGRFEVVQDICPIILDVGHNAQAMRWLVEQLRQMPIQGQTYMLFGLADKKSLVKTLQPLQGVADSWYVVPLQGCDSYQPTKIASELEALGEKNCYTNDSLSQTLDKILAVVTSQDRIVVCGSFFAVSEAKQYLGGSY